MSKRHKPKPVHLALTAPAKSDVAIGEKTGRQMLGERFGGALSLSGFFPAPAGTYKTYREISSHPTVALVMSIVKDPIIGNEWIWNKRSKDVPDLWLRLIERTLGPKRHQIVSDMLHSLDMSWAPFEKVWDYREVHLGDMGDGEMTSGSDARMYAMVLDWLKPLVWEETQLWEDDRSGRITGIVNKSVIGEVKLPLNKCLFHINDPMPGQPYGRSRHENIRQTWNEAEQLRQRIAQYMKKVAGIVVQLHYPEGTSKDANGADLPNQWHAQKVLDMVATGYSVMLPNGYASIDPRVDPKGAYDLAGKSQWVLSTLNTAGTDFAPGMREILEYYDQLLFQGWLRPARSGLEARYGSRADAQQHSATGIYDCESIDRSICLTINQQLIDDILTMNFGERARGAVFVEPTPIADTTITEKASVLKAIIASQFGGQAISQIDLRSLADDLDLKLVSGGDGNKPVNTLDDPAIAAPPGRQQAVKLLQDAGYSGDEINKRMAKKAKKVA